MKIVLTGGGTGGHVYPLIAVAERLNREFTKEKILDSAVYYFASSPYDKEALYENHIEFVYIPAGKLRTYFSVANITDIFKTLRGIIRAWSKLFRLYPDVVFSKGGFSSFPTLLAARILGIPVIIHESDTVPGRVNVWAAKFAKYVAISYQEAAEYFPEEKTAWVGQPIRQGVQEAITDGAHEYLQLDPGIPVVLILGGSQGAKKVNNAVIAALPELVDKYQVIHQTGLAHLEQVKEEASHALLDHPHASRYKSFGFLQELALQMAGGAADVVVSRAGSMLFEIAAWGVPTIVIPITNSHGDHQLHNATAYAELGAGILLQEKNLATSILINEIDRILRNDDLRKDMIEAARSYTRKDAATKIAEKIVAIALPHEG